MARFIAVSVLPDESSDVHLVAARGAAVCGKQLVQLLAKLRATADQLDESGNIVRSEECVLPRVRLGKSKSHFAGIERLDPVAIAERAHKPRNRIEHVLVRLRTPAVALVIVSLAEHPGDL